MAHPSPSHSLAVRVTNQSFLPVASRTSKPPPLTTLQEVPTGLGHPATSSASILVLEGKGPETREESLASPRECGDSRTRGGRVGDTCPWGFTKLGSSLRLP